MSLGIASPDLVPRNSKPTIVPSDQVVIEEAIGSTTPYSPVVAKASISQNPVFTSTAIATSALKQENHLSIPLDLRNDIQQFKIEGYASKFFSTQRKGLFRRKVPIQEMLEYQKVF